MIIQKIVLRRKDELHGHLRRGWLLRETLPYVARYASRMTVMPNTKPHAILSGGQAIGYRDEILRARDSWYQDEVRYGREPVPFEPLMTIEIRNRTTPKMIRVAKKAGVLAGKSYAINATTNSGRGVKNYFAPLFLDTLSCMQDEGMLWLQHGELVKPRLLITKRENEYLPILGDLSLKFPNLKMVLEHISTKEGIEMVKSLGKNVAGTLTLQHMCMTLNDVLGDGIHPDNMCMPVLKDFPDMDAIFAAATSGNPKFFMGNDIAPHHWEKKYCAKGACGVASHFVASEGLTERFVNANKTEKLDDFTSGFGAEFYGLPKNEGEITLVKKRWVVPDQIGSVVPFMSGRTMEWQLER